MIRQIRSVARAVHQIDEDAVSRSPHLHRRLVFFALAVVLVSSFIGMRILQTSDATAIENLSASGVHFMTGPELLVSYDHSKSEIKPYWVGDSVGFSYTGSSVEHFEYVISYISGGVDQPDSARESFKIDTYLNEDEFKNDPQGATFIDPAEMTTPSGREVLFYQGDMRRAEVRIPGTSEVVLVNFLMPESLSAMLTFADSLIPLV
ncbi:MAG: hypothetical protein NTX12_01315 [Actinobacteria bacterium]|nr:hypothetical protein [Actinomycetota bacterium]